jgi:hypothetical protein
MFKYLLPLIFVLLAPASFSQALQPRRDDPNSSNAALPAAQDDKQRRRDELRAALKSQGDEGVATPAKTISLQDRAALREQLRLQGITASPHH